MKVCGMLVYSTESSEIFESKDFQFIWSMGNDKIPDPISIGFDEIAHTDGHVYFSNYNDKSRIDYDYAVNNIIDTYGNITGKFIINIEHWPLGIGITNEERLINADKYIEAINATREALPEALIGLYGMLPIRDYWSYVLGDIDSIEEIEYANSQLSIIAESVDIIYPSLYTFYYNEDQPENSIDEWKIYADSIIIEASKYNKPVYPFIMPRIHPSNSDLAWSLIEENFLIEQIRFISDRTEGIVFWDAPTWYHSGDPYYVEWFERVSEIIEEINNINNKIVDYSNSYEGIYIDLYENISSGGHADGDIFINIDNINGSTYNDIIAGNENSNKLHGDDGDDQIFAYGSGDILYGGEGNDEFFSGISKTSIFGGEGNDVFFNVKHNDYILGGSGYDKIIFDVGNMVGSGQIVTEVESFESTTVMIFPDEILT